MKSFGSEVLRTIVFIAMLAGAPIYMITTKYDLYATVVNNPLTNKLTGYGVLVLIILTPIVLFIIKARISSAEPTVQKKLMWGLLTALPVGVGYLVANWVSVNIEFVKDILMYTAIPMVFAYLVAPEFIVDYKQKKS